MSSILGYVPSVAHDFSGHPEHAGRLRAVWQRLDSAELLGDFAHIQPVAASTENLKLAHTADLIELIEWACQNGGGFLGADTYLTSESAASARLAAGTTMVAAQAIATGQAHNGLVLVRPPGHHASAARAEGFCLFNNIALAARQAQQMVGINRVCIVDFDVHHANGTQAIFYDDPSVLVISAHQYSAAFYPGSGDLDERGVALGEGSTLNVPLPSGAGDVAIQHFFDAVMQPKIVDFAPDMLLVSAGFDGHWRDPLAALSYSLTSLAELTRKLLALAAAHCDGRILFVSEGGYDLDVLAAGFSNVAALLLGRDRIDDPFGVVADSWQDTAYLSRQLTLLHQLG